MRPLDPPSDVVAPPGADELSYSDGEPLESNRHARQITLLLTLLERRLGAVRPDYFVGSNMFFYFSALQTRKNDFRGPDVFVALGVEHRDRKSWVVWEEDGKVPDVIVELTSESTAEDDRGAKMRVYARLNVGEYYIYDPLAGALEGYHLDLDTSTYRPISATDRGHLPSGKLGLELGVWDGPYHGFPGPWLRCFEPGGELVLLGEEAEREEHRRREEAERLQAEERRRREEAERQQAEERRRREEAERQQAEERRRREEAERQLADALAELARLRGQ